VRERYKYFSAASPPDPAISPPGVRHLLYGHRPHIYRVIYRVLEKQKEVDVLHVRHGARNELKA
jgi:plasmid stabilization system protein ParE